MEFQLSTRTPSLCYVTAASLNVDGSIKELTNGEMWPADMYDDLEATPASHFFRMELQAATTASSGCGSAKEQTCLVMS